MAIYANHAITAKKVADGSLFLDDFNRPDGPVGYGWSTVGPDVPEIVSNALLFNSITPDTLSGISRFTGSPEDDAEIFLSLRTITKYNLDDAKLVLELKKGSNSLLIEIQTDDVNPAWTNAKKINVLTFIDGVKSLIYTQSVTFDTSAQNFIRILATKKTVKINYLVDGEFSPLNSFEVIYGIPVDSDESYLGLYAQEAEIEVDLLDIRSHEYAYFYGVPDHWYVDTGSELIVPQKGTLRVDTFNLPLNVNNRFDVSLKTDETQQEVFVDPGPATLEDVAPELPVEIIGGDAFAMFNRLKLGTPSGAASTAGKSPYGMDNARVPVVFLNSEEITSDILSYSPDNDKVYIPVETNADGLVYLLMEDSSGDITYIDSDAVKAHVKKRFNLSAKELVTNEPIIIWAVFLEV
jgi:hypothetical protein